MKYIKIILRIVLICILVYIAYPILHIIVILFFPSYIIYISSKSFHRVITLQNESNQHIIFDKHIIIISILTLFNIITVYYYFLNFILFDLNFIFDYQFIITVLIFPALIMLYSSFNPVSKYLLKNNMIEDEKLFEDQNKYFQKFLASVFISTFMFYFIFLILWYLENVEFGWKD